MTTTAPRITLEDINNNISSEHYFTAADGAIGSEEGYSKIAYDSLKLLTFCVLILKNGFTVTGESACVSPENFDAEIGRSVAKENAINKIWPLMGYQLKSEVSKTA